jgi:hypothetical protein
MAHIQNADYETITVVCDHCQALNTYNRLDDIGDPGPYASRHINCLVCEKQFHICADTWMPAYQFFIHAADEQVKLKRFMPAVTQLGQAWELFFATYLYGNYAYRPFFAATPSPRDIDHLHTLTTKLHAVIVDFTFGKLRNMFTRTILNNWHPSTLAEADAALARVIAEKIWKPVDANERAIHPVVGDRRLLDALYKLEIDGLRNRVVHKEAHRPSRVELERCQDGEIRLLYRIKRKFKVADFHEIASQSGLTSR